MNLYTRTYSIYLSVLKKGKGKKAVKKNKRKEWTVNNTGSCLPLNGMTSKWNKIK